MPLGQQTHSQSSPRAMVVLLLLHNVVPRHLAWLDIDDIGSARSTSALEASITLAFQRLEKTSMMTQRSARPVVFLGIPWSGAC